MTLNLDGEENALKMLNKNILFLLLITILSLTLIDCGDHSCYKDGLHDFKKYKHRIERAINQEIEKDDVIELKVSGDRKTRICVRLFFLKLIKYCDLTIYDHDDKHLFSYDCVKWCD